MSDEAQKARMAYAYSPAYARYCDLHERTKGRASLTHNTIAAYGLFKLMDIIEPKLASESDLEAFHSRSYVSLLRRAWEAGEIGPDLAAEAAEAGLSEDCPLLPSTFTYVRLVAGATLQLVRLLVSGAAEVAINWGGGWHHATAEAAAGFCYINDPVLAILALRDHFPRVLYLDLDAHHGDGVEEAFKSSPKVFTLSIHHKSAGFYPGTGSLGDVGVGRGRFATLNIPLAEGLSTVQFQRLLRSILPELRRRFEPSAVVVQCGVDSLARDPIGAFNLTPDAFITAFQVMREWKRPMLVLGGGGYDAGNAARAWTRITNELLQRPPLPLDIPDSHPNFLAFSPDYSLEMTEGRLRNCNPDSEIDSIISTALLNLANFQCQ